MDAKAIKATLMGFAPNGYRLWNKEKQRIVISRDVTFNETLNKIHSSNSEGGVCSLDYESSSSDDETDGNSTNEVENVTLETDDENENQYVSNQKSK